MSQGFSVNCEVSTAHCGKAGSLRASSAPSSPTNPISSVTAGVDTAVVLQFPPERGQFANLLFSPHDTWALQVSLVSKWGESCSLDIQFPLTGFPLSQCLGLSPPGFSFWYSKSNLLNLQWVFFYPLGICLCWCHESILEMQNKKCTLFSQP